MNDRYYEDQMNDLSEKTRALSRGYKLLALCLVMFFSLFNVGDTFVISRFRQIFQDALGPDHPLPFLSHIFLDGQILITCLAILWPILGLLAVLRFKSFPLTAIILACLITVVIIQIGLTWIGLILPLFSGVLPAPMSDSTQHL